MRVGIFTVIVLNLSLTACSHLTKFSYRKSVLNRHHSSPHSLSHLSKSVVDKTFLQTEADYHYSLGEAVSLDGDSKVAIEEFKLALIYDPESTIIRLRMAAEYLKLGQLNDAVEYRLKRLYRGIRNLKRAACY